MSGGLRAGAGRKHADGINGDFLSANSILIDAQLLDIHCSGVAYAESIGDRMDGTTPNLIFVEHSSAEALCLCWVEIWHTEVCVPKKGHPPKCLRR